MVSTTRALQLFFSMDEADRFLFDNSKFGWNQGKHWFLKEATAQASSFCQKQP